MHGCDENIDSSKKMDDISALPSTVKKKKKGNIHIHPTLMMSLEPESEQ